MYKKPKPDFKLIGMRIKARRKEMGLTQENLAELMDCSSVQISRIECGSRTSVDGLILLSIYLDLSLDELLGLYPGANPVTHEVNMLISSLNEAERKIACEQLRGLCYVLKHAKELDYKFLGKKE